MKIITKYAELITKKPYFLLFLFIAIFFIASVLSGRVHTEDMDYSTLLPEDIEVIKASNLVTDSFGGTDQALFVIELDKDYRNELTNESLKDIRFPEVIKYIDVLTTAGDSIDGISSSTSASTVLRALNQGMLPRSSNDINYAFELNPLIYNYVSKDYSMALVKLSVETDADAEQVLAEMRDIIQQTPRPEGITVNVGGETVADIIVSEQIGPDMGRTSSLSMVGIVIILFLMFWSVKYALSPMAALGVGIVWAFGFIGLIGMNMNSATSGVISMIMGIGIDFGIQIVTRFRDELQFSDANKAMIKTLEQVIIPMFTTTIAALIGFKAMAMGELTLMADMGKMMSFGITACFLSAITIVPIILIISSRLKEKKHVFAKILNGNKMEKNTGGKRK